MDVTELYAVRQLLNDVEKLTIAHNSLTKENVMLKKLLFHEITRADNATDENLTLRKTIEEQKKELKARKFQEELLEQLNSDLQKSINEFQLEIQQNVVDIEKQKNDIDAMNMKIDHLKSSRIEFKDLFWDDNHFLFDNLNHKLNTLESRLRPRLLRGRQGHKLELVRSMIEDVEDLRIFLCTDMYNSYQKYLLI